MPNAEGCPVCGEHNWLYNLFPYTLGAINILPNTTMQDSNHSYDNYYYVTDNFMCSWICNLKMSCTNISIVFEAVSHILACCY